MRRTGAVLALLDLASVVVVSLLLLPGTGPLPVAAAAGGALLVVRGTGLGRPRLVLGVVADLPSLLLAALVATALLGATDHLAGADAASAVGLGVTAAATYAVLVLVRTAAYALVHVLRRTGTIAHPALVVGTDPVGRQVAEALLARREHGLVPVGMVDCGPPGNLHGLPLPLLGDLAHLDRVADEHRVAHLVFAFPDPPDPETVAVVRSSVARGRTVYVVPRFLELVGVPAGRQSELVRDIALVRMPGVRPPAPVRVVTRALDVVVALAGLLVLSPVLLLIAVAVRVETGAGVFHRQLRVGEGGATFTLLKFRSLRPATFVDGARSWRIDNASRIGPVGRLLRRTGLDDLPQLLDVLRGDLSLVGNGPWPELVEPVRAPAETEATTTTFYVERWALRDGVRRLLACLVPPR